MRITKENYFMTEKGEGITVNGHADIGGGCLEMFQCVC